MRRYLLITPCRDEGKFARKTLDSVVAQTVRPARWVIVDDGSSDDTPAILAEYAAKYDWITVVRREDRGKRSVGPGVIDAFYAGLEKVKLDEYDYLCKLDLDLILPPGYFEGLMRKMEDNPRLGTCSGKTYYIDEQGREISEGISDEMSIGASKFYRRTCFKQIGGFVRQVMWDGIDCHRCRLLGWQACSFGDRDLMFVHLRPMGSSQQSMWVGRKRWGYGQYFMGTSLTYITVSAAYRMMQPPLIVGGIGIWWGFVQSAMQGKPRYGDAEFRRFVRKCQWAFLLKGKAKAVKDLEQRQASRWNPDAAGLSGQLGTVIAG
ncbi:MAG: glycosyltransferase family 2 protein [Phycisphaeraceae bacterium]|nr:glycosyltransferase family 2 protein [Phycisphaeraceae bacterium]